MTNTNSNHDGNQLKFIDVKIAVPWGHLIGRWYGNRKIRPILALHGWLDNLGTWNNLIPLLPKHLGVLCFDAPGHGHSSKLPPGVMYNALVFSGIISLIMQEYNWSKVSLLGHSMGGRMSFIFASVFPQRVDMIVLIDVLHPHIHTPDVHIKAIRTSIDKFLIEDGRFGNIKFTEPPSYTIEQLKRIQFEGTGKSVDPANTHHIYERNVTKSNIYPNKFYFSRDGRIKHYVVFNVSSTEAVKMAERITDVPFLVIKASKSVTITEESQGVIDTLSRNNINFEMHEVKGAHHIHLTNASVVADVMNRFIYRHRPPPVEAWCTGDEHTESKNKRSKL